MNQTLASNILGRGFNKGLTAGEASRWRSHVHCHGEGEEDYWGFHIYRTTYTPESDRDFASGLRILSRHLREACFYGAGSDDTPNKELWARMKNTVIDDRVQFDSVPPTVIQRHFQTWIEAQGYHVWNGESEDPSHKFTSSATYRFCVIIDADALRNLLRFSFSANPQARYDDRIGVKVLDVQCHAGNEDYEPPFDQGWMWAGPSDLANIWFETEDLGVEEIFDTDALGRPVFMKF